jgi:hypothetical protein
MSMKAFSDHQQSWGYEDGPWKGPGPPLLVAADSICCCAGRRLDSFKDASQNGKRRVIQAILLGGAKPSPVLHKQHGKR